MNVTVVKVLAVLTLSLCTAPVVAVAQPADKVSQIGFPGVGSRGPYHEVFEKAFGERGWMNGKNLIIVYRHAEEKYELPHFLFSMVQRAACFRWSNAPLD